MIFPNSMLLALAAIFVEALVAYPDRLYRLVGHPMSWIGRVVSFGEARLNRADLPVEERRNRGMFLVAAVLILVLVLSVSLAAALSDTIAGFAVMALCASTLLAQRSLYKHVRSVADALARSVADGRAALSRIADRDVDRLDEAGVARAAIETLAENLPIGVVGPALALALFGLPGAALCMAVNTIAGVIGHPTPRYLDFGGPALRLDHAMNWLVVRICAWLLVAAALFGLRTTGRDAVRVIRRETAGTTASNAGWPVAAFAGALGLKLGGPRNYGGVVMPGRWIGEDRIAADSDAIRRALALYVRALIIQFMALALLTLLLL